MSKKTKKGFTGIEVLVVVVVIILLAGGYWILQNRTPAVSPQPQTPTSTSSTPDIPAGWVTYLNKEEGFSVKYPPEWTTEVLEDPYDWSSSSFAIVLLSPDFETTTEELVKGGKFSIQIAPKDVFANNLVPIGEYPENSHADSGKLLSEEEIFVSGVKVVKRSFNQILGLGPDSISVAVTLQREDEAYLLDCNVASTSLDELLTVCDQIFSTFEFTE